MPHVIPDSIRNPGCHSGVERNPSAKDRIAAPGSGSGTGHAAITSSVHPEMVIFTDLGVGLKF